MIDSLIKLNLPLGKFAVFGSGPICIRGLRSWHDVDLIVTREFFDTLKNNKLNWFFEISKSGSEKLTSSDKSIEVWKDWQPGDWDVNHLIRDSEIINGIPFVRLEEVLRWKKLRNSPKDILDVQLIESFLSSNL